MSEKAALITVTYRGDADLARELCASVDRFVPQDVEHVLIIPRRDHPYFSGIERGRRRIVYQEDLLPLGSYRLPLPSRILGRRLRDFWSTPFGIVRGWIAQQLVKLSVDRATRRELIVFADSDVVFVRPFNVERLMRGDRAKLYHRPGETKDSPRHQNWHRVSTKLLGLQETNYTGADYIGQLVVWRASVLRELHFRMEKTNFKPWQKTVCECSDISEYVLYGVFVEHVTKSEGHFLDTESQAHCSWHYPNLGGFDSGLEPHHVAVLIQSTTELALDERRRLLARMIEQATESQAAA